MFQSDLLMPVAVVGILIMMVMPLPSAIVDVLLTVNIALALGIVLISMYTKHPLEFSVFPSILLIATLFRLALNVSTTRLILLHGSAGNVIAAFGQSVVGGDYIVGFVVFLILVLIQYIVITNGAQRVAEVAARFTLDEMPGKQLGVDADLNAGIIDEAEAKRRRREIQREADFYGAMDGASKFVRGDAIAALVIIAVNLIGGIAVGALRLDLSVPEALRKFALLTVGDGLVGQVPALLISTATGLVVTRAASEASLGTEVVSQVLAQPRAILIVAVLLVVFGLLPGLPTVSFMVVGAIAAAVWWTATRQPRPAVEPEEPAPGPPLVPGAEDLVQLVASDPVTLELGYGLVPLADSASGGTLLERVTGVRRQIAATCGLIVPPVRVRDSGALESDRYVIKLRDSTVASGRVMPDLLLAMGGPEDAAPPPGETCEEPLFGLPATWIAPADRAVAEAGGFTLVDPAAVIATHLSEAIKRHAGEILTRQDVQLLIDAVRESSPAVVTELIPERATLGDVQRVLKSLLAEGVPIRNLEAILEAISDGLGQTQRLEEVTELVRRSIARQICDTYRDEDGLHVFALDPDVEQAIADAVVEGSSGPVAVPEPSFVQRLVRAVAAAAERMAALGKTPVLLTTAAIRPHVRGLVGQVLPHLPVLSHAELIAEDTIHCGEMVNVGPEPA